MGKSATVKKHVSKILTSESHLVNKHFELKDLCKFPSERTIKCECVSEYKNMEIVV